MSAQSFVQVLQEFAELLEEDYGASPDLSTPERLSIALCAIRDCRADLAVLYKRVEADLLAVAGEKRWVVEGVGEVEVKRSTKRNEWDSPALIRKLVALALDERILDETTGEYEPSYEAVARVLSEAARMEWRVTPLKARHIPIDEYCRVASGVYSVRLPPRQVD